MDPDFWLARWHRGETGWHRGDFDPHLVDLWPLMDLPADTRVLVPLCGKSLDLLWLAGRGHRVLGVELSRLAVAAFFEENGLPATTRSLAVPGRPPLELWRADEIEILCGDFFDLEPAHAQGIGAVYDRAALVALPPELRPRYAARIDRLAPERIPHLLIALEYDQSRMPGPPFSVEAPEVESLFGATHRIHPLVERDVLDESPHLRARGLARLVERVYRLDPRG